MPFPACGWNYRVSYVHYASQGTCMHAYRTPKAHCVCIEEGDRCHKHLLADLMVLVFPILGGQWWVCAHDVGDGTPGGNAYLPNQQRTLVYASVSVRCGIATTAPISEGWRAMLNTYCSMRMPYGQVLTACGGGASTQFFTCGAIACHPVS